MAQSVSSAEPEKLFRYSNFGMQVDHALDLEAIRLASALQHFEATCTEPGFQVGAGHLGDGLRGYAGQSESVDSWVRQVGHGFQMADRGSFGTALWPGDVIRIKWPLPRWVAGVISLIPVLPALPGWIVRLLPHLPWLRREYVTVLPEPAPTPVPAPTPMPVPKEPAPQEIPTDSTPQPAPTPRPAPMPTRESDKKPGSQPLPEEGESSQFTPTSKPTFEQSPVPFDQVTGINWYGNTEFAYHNRANYYSQVQGLHSGLDFVVLAGTPITSTVNRPGKVISVNGKPYNYKAGPGSILVDYGDFMVLYGHTSRSDAKVGDTVEPGQIVGYTGTDEYGTEHLHMEVIKKDPGWEALSQEKKAITRPGSVRTNPVPYLAPDLRKQLEEKQWGAFHPTADNKWQTPDDQPDIIPGKPYVI